MIVDLDENTLTRAFGGGGDHPGLGCGTHVGQFSGTAGIIEDLGSLFAVCDAVLENREHLGCVIGANAIAGTKVLIDPHVYAGVLFHRTRGYWPLDRRGGPGARSNRPILTM